MNSVELIGRLTRDPEDKSKQDLEVVTFNLAVDRPGAKGETNADFPKIVCFGKTADIAEKYLRKGARVGIKGHLQTGSYDRDGVKVYTTDVIAERLFVIDWPDDKSNTGDAWPEAPGRTTYDRDPFSGFPF